MHDKIKNNLVRAALAVLFISPAIPTRNETVKTPPPEQEVTDTVSSDNSADSMRTIVNRSHDMERSTQGNQKKKN